VSGTAVVTPIGTACKANSISSQIYSTGPTGLTSNSYSLLAVGTGTTPDAQNAIDDDNVAVSRKFQFRIADGAVNFITFDTSGSLNSYISTAAISATKLANGFVMGASASQAAVSVYLDGVKTTATPSGTMSSPTGDFYIGNRKDSGSQGWVVGGLSLVAGWSRTLSDAEFVSLAADPAQIFLDEDDEEEAFLKVVAGGISYTLTIAAGSFALSGGSVGLGAARRMSGVTAAYALSGSAIGLRFGHRLAATSATYAFSGGTVALRTGRRLGATQGSYAITGVAVGLFYSSLGRYLSAAVGTYSMTGSLIAARATRRMQAAPGLFSFVAGTVGLALGRRVLAVVASYLISGKPIQFGRQQRLNVESGAFQFAGYGVGLSYSAAINYGRAPAGFGFARFSSAAERLELGGNVRISTTNRSNR
jgi:hypothetical protein